MSTSKAKRRKAKPSPLTRASALLPAREIIEKRIDDMRERLYDITGMAEVANRSINFEDDNHLSRVLRKIVSDLEGVANELDSAVMLSTEGGAA